LRVGDRVVVHEHRADAPAGGCDGTIVFVSQHRRHNAVGLRLDDDATAVRWLTRFEVDHQAR
jgi:hypothetical protein